MSLLASASKFVFPFGSTLRISSWFFSHFPFWLDRIGSQKKTRVRGFPFLECSIRSTSANSVPRSQSRIGKTLENCSGPPTRDSSASRALTTSALVWDAEQHHDLEVRAAEQQREYDLGVDAQAPDHAVGLDGGHPLLLVERLEVVVGATGDRLPGDAGALLGLLLAGLVLDLPPKVDVQYVPLARHVGRDAVLDPVVERARGAAHLALVDLEDVAEALPLRQSSAR